jgi:hypothetical protein
MWRERVSYILISSLAFVSMEGGRENVNSVVEAVFVSTEDRKLNVKTVVVVAYVITEREKEYALCVEGVDSALMASKRTAALNANESKGKLFCRV